MEGRGSGLEDWRGKAHLGSSLPVSACCCPCPLVISCVHMSWPVSAHHCLCPCVVAHVRMSLPVSTHHCLCLRVVAHVARVHSHSWAVVFIYGQWHSVVVGSCWWVVVCPQGWRRCVVAWLLWSHRGARWCMSQLSCCCLVATSPAATGHL